MTRALRCFFLTRQSACQELGVDQESVWSPFSFVMKNVGPQGALGMFLLSFETRFYVGGIQSKSLRRIYSRATRTFQDPWVCFSTQPRCKHCCGLPRHFLSQWTALSVWDPRGEQAPLSLGVWCLVGSSPCRDGEPADLSPQAGRGAFNLQMRWLMHLHSAECPKGLSRHD